MNGNKVATAYEALLVVRADAVRGGDSERVYDVDLAVDYLLLGHAFEHALYQPRHLRPDTESRYRPRHLRATTESAS